MTHAPLGESSILTPLTASMANSTAPQMQVLVVEDHPPIRHAMNRLICQAGFGVTLAGSIQEGLSMLGGKDCLLLDLNLPDGCGIRLLRHVREKALPLHVAVITATGDPNLLREVNDLKPDAVFIKPIDIEQVLSWIERVPQSKGLINDRRNPVVRGISNAVVPNFSWHMRWPRVGK